MRKGYILLLSAMVMGLSSCTTTYMVIKKSAMDNAINEVAVEMEKYGYYPAGSATDTKNEVIVTGQSYSKYSGYGTKMDNNYITSDVFRFADTLGNSMNYTVSYQLREKDKLFYVTDLYVKGCETSNVRDYNKLCGANSPKNIIERLPKDTPVSLYDETKTYILVGVLSLAACIPLLIAASSSSYSY